MALLVGLSPTAKATTGSVTLYLNGASGATRDTLCPPGSLGTVLGTLENAAPSSSVESSTSQNFDFCTSAAGAYNGPAFAVTSISVTLYVATFDGNIIYLLAGVLSQGGTTISNLTPSSLSGAPSWSMTSCAAVTFSMPVPSGAVLNPGDVDLAFGILSSNVAITDAQVCAGGSTPSSITISGVSSGTTTVTSTTTVTDTTTVTSATTVTTTTTVTSGSGGSGCYLYLLDLNTAGGVPGPYQSIGDFYTPYQGSFKADSFSWDGPAGTPGPGTGTGGPGHNPALTEMNFSMMSSEDSAGLLLAAVTGKTMTGTHFYVIDTCAVVKGVPQPVVTMTFAFQNLVVTSYHVSGMNGQSPEDQITVSFTKVVFTTGTLATSA